MERYLVFGYAAASTRADLARLVDVVAEHADVPVVARRFASYEELTRAVRARVVDLAWLPPIAFIAVERDGLVVPLASPARGAAGEASLGFTSVIVVRRRSLALGLRDLVGCRAAWVDPFSASGYVLPRLELDGAGVALASFASETFYGAHVEVVRAVATGQADFGGTYATYGPRGEIVRSAWRERPDLAAGVRVLARVGSLPSEVIAARSDMPAALQTVLTRALVATSRDSRNRALLHEALGADELKPWKAPGYDLLRTETERAAVAGLI